MKSAFDGHLGRLDIARENISELDNRSKEISKLKCKKKMRKKPNTEHSRIGDNFGMMSCTYLKHQENIGSRRNIWRSNDQEFSKLMTVTSNH